MTSRRDDEHLIDEFDGDGADDATVSSSFYPSVPKLTSTAVARTAAAPIVTAAAAAAPQVTNNNMETTRKWKDVLVGTGIISVEFAWKYALALTANHRDETNAHLLTSQDLANMGVGSDQAERDALLRSIAALVKETAEEEEVKEQDDLVAVRVRWRNLLNRAAKLVEWGGSKTSNAYAAALAQHGWDETNADELDEDKLVQAGVTDARHREIILELIDREIAEAELLHHPGDAAAAAALDREMADSKHIQARLQRDIEAFDVFQQRLSAILRGDTAKQREARAQREQQRAERRAQRLQQQRRRM